MQQQIEKLKQEREKLTVEYRNNQIEYKFEIRKIDRAISNFEKGMNELTGIAKPKKQKSYSEIESILLEDGALHIKELVKKLHERGFPMTYPSVSGLLQLYAKAGKKFVKVSPATYGLLEPGSVVKPEVFVEPNSANKPNTVAKKKPLTNVQTNSNANGGNEPRNAPAETVAEKQTIIYEVEKSEAGESGNGEY